ncbi:MAG: hypothetical protein EP330_13925 [Deltaproteobacteria bacterium]|nr:MAG: hypothetical protein EP330_13925 [Deltaproteobacteria bacterium]
MRMAAGMAAGTTGGLLAGVAIGALVWIVAGTPVWVMGVIQGTGLVLGAALGTTPGLISATSSSHRARRRSDGSE